jgi:hypothetical protein
VIKSQSSPDFEEGEGAARQDKEKWQQEVVETE